jgi:hypothetical protein
LYVRALDARDNNPTLRRCVMNLAKTGYIVSDATLVQLTKEFGEGIDKADGVRGNFLKILVAHSKRALGKWNVKRATTEKALEAVDEAYGHLYAVVLEAITTPDLQPDPDVSQEERTRRAYERNRRSTFARSAKSTLVAWINAGGRLATLNPAEVTKEELRSAYAGEGTSASARTLESRIASTASRLEAFVKELAEDDLEEAREAVEELIGRLQALVEPEAPPGKHRPLTARKKRIGELTLHPH